MPDLASVGAATQASYSSLSPEPLKDKVPLTPTAGNSAAVVNTTAQPAAQDLKTDGDKDTKKPVVQGQENAEATENKDDTSFYTKVKDKFYWVGDKISELAHSNIKDEDNANLLLTILKVKPLAFILLFMPPFVAVAALTILFTVTVLKPSAILNNAASVAFASRTLGLYSLVSSIKEAILMGFSTTPQWHLAAVATYFFFARTCFVLAENIAPIFKNQKAIDDKGPLDKKAGDKPAEEPKKEEVNNLTGLKLLGQANKARVEKAEREKLEKEKEVNTDDDTAKTDDDTAKADASPEKEKASDSASPAKPETVSSPKKSVSAAAPQPQNEKPEESDDDKPADEKKGSPIASGQATPAASPPASPNKASAKVAAAAAAASATPVSDKKKADSDGEDDGEMVSPSDAKETKQPASDNEDNE